MGKWPPHYSLLKSQPLPSFLFYLRVQSSGSGIIWGSSVQTLCLRGPWLVYVPTWNIGFWCLHSSFWQSTGCGGLGHLVSCGGGQMPLSAGVGVGLKSSGRELSFCLVWAWTSETDSRAVPASAPVFSCQSAVPASECHDLPLWGQLTRHLKSQVRISENFPQGAHNKSGVGLEVGNPFVNQT